MARIVMIGGGVVGLGAALMLGLDGHDVVVLERDPAPPPAPGEAWNGWERRGVNQFRLLHYLPAGYKNLMDANGPGIVAALRDAGALNANPLAEAPAEVTGGYRDSDAKFENYTARRPVIEAAVASVVAGCPNVTVRRGVGVAGLLTGTPVTPGVPHVVGVRTDGGEEIRGDVVIDAGGRRSNLPGLLADVGARAPIEEKEDSGFVYYGRHYRSPDGSVPMAFGGLLHNYGSVSTLTLPADNGTWGAGFVASAKDTAMRRVSDPETFARAIQAFPFVAHWLEGEPLDDSIIVMAKIEDRHRTFVIDGQPVATGVLALGDAWAATNPSVGRGITVGTIHAVALRDVLHDVATDPVDLARRFHAATLATAEPWYRDTLAFDRARLAEIDAAIDGVPFDAPATYDFSRSLENSLMKDPDMMRAFIEVAAVITPSIEVAERPGVRDKAMALGGGWRDEALPGPSRQELLSLVGAA